MFLPKEQHSEYKHGHSLADNRSLTYKSWVAMKSRCNPENKDIYPVYAGRGIEVCERWKNSFENFLEDMGERPEGMTIDRIDSSKGYFPGNCRWADNKTQADNRETTIWIEINGEEMVLSDVSKKYGIPQTTIYRRYKEGLRGRDLISKDNRNKLRVGEKANGTKLNDQKVKEIRVMVKEGFTQKEIGAKFGVSASVISEIKNKKAWGHVK